MKRIMIVVLSLLVLSSCRAIVINPFPHISSHPPVHAPAHGHREHAYDYYYYPNSYVYFSPTQNVYYYLSNNQWKTAVTLPRNIRMNLGKRVNLKANSERPYKEHNQHKRTYKANRSKERFGKEKRSKEYRSKEKFSKERRSKEKSSKEKKNKEKRNKGKLSKGKKDKEKLSKNRGRGERD